MQRLVFVLWVLLLLAGCEQPGPDPLPSWQIGSSRAAIMDFVESTTTPGSPAYVPEAERIAVFDNDGTLWAEQPYYFQLGYVLYRLQELAPQHPEWREQEPFASALSGGVDGVFKSGGRAISELVIATHTGMTQAEFSASVKNWLATAKHPTTGRLYTEMVYQPMLELLAYLRAHGYKTFIVSGGGIEFMRAYADQVYGVPPEQVVGTSIQASYEVYDGIPVLLREPKIRFINDGPRKVVEIQQHIGRRPVIAFGNSDGDFQMLEWTTSAAEPRFGALIHHDDAARAWAYDRDSPIGHLERALDEAPARGWLVVSMRDDWVQIFPELASGASVP